MRHGSLPISTGLHALHARTIMVTALLAAALTSHAGAQILDLRELNTEQIRALPLERTVILMPGGILEQHGPYLPSYTDGYQNEHDARRVAEAIVARRGWVVLMFPSIPLGAGGANSIGLKPVFPGTYHVHYETLRAVYMDLAAELGEAGFRWIFVFQNHGAVGHKMALDQAGEFFGDTYGGRMVHLGGLVIPAVAQREPLLSTEAQQENGLDVHSGFAETSTTLFLRPDLVDPRVSAAEPRSGPSWSALVDIGVKDGWPGYLGSPRLATATDGAEIMRRRVEDLSSLVLRILDGLDPRTLPSVVEQRQNDPGVARYTDVAAEHEQRIKSIQQDWLNRKGKDWP